MKFSKKIKGTAIVLTSLVILTSTAVALTPHFIRQKAETWGVNHGMKITFKEAHLRPWGVMLEDVRAEMSNPQKFQAFALEVRLIGFTSLDRIEVHNGTVDMEGPMESFRKHSEYGDQKDSHKSPEIAADGLTIRWKKWSGDNSLIYADWVGIRMGKKTEANSKTVRIENQNFEVLAEGMQAEKTDCGGRFRFHSLNVTVKEGASGSLLQSPIPGVPGATGSHGAVCVALNTDSMTLDLPSRKVDIAEFGFTGGRGENKNIDLGWGAKKISTKGIEVEDSGGSIHGIMSNSEMNLFASSMTIEHPSIAEDPVQFKHISTKSTIKRNEGIQANGWLQVEHVIIPFDIDWNEDEYKIRSVLQPSIPDRETITTEIIPVKCENLVESVPSLLKDVGQVELDGDIALAFGVEKIRNADPIVTFKMDEHCKIVRIPDEFSVKKFGKKFHRKILNAYGGEEEVETGPGTDGWTYLGFISPYMPLAVMMTEDPGFKNHHGFDVGAIANAVRDDIKTHKFLRGASTISMQLAKNLWLDRGKTAQRKVMEAILTKYLEQTLGKDAIMELYLNVVEFAPGLYGIGKASRHYFKTTPENLSLSQCLFLSLMLPRPKANPFEKDGRLSKKRMELIYVLMRGLKDKNWISEDEYKDGLGEWVIRGEPRPDRVAVGSSPSGEIDTSDWE